MTRADRLRATLAQRRQQRQHRLAAYDGTDARRYHECLRKVPYASAREADTVGRFRIRAEAARGVYLALRAYHCPWCGAWHLATDTITGAQRRDLRNLGYRIG